MPPAKLSVVVGTYNRLAQIKACVESILQETRTPVHVYVTDAGSTDGTVEYLESIRSEIIRPVLEGHRMGQARAYNRVFETLQTPFVCWLSDDNVVVSGGLDIAVGILEDDAGIGMVGLKTRDKQGPFTAAPYIGGLSPFGILNVNQGVLRTEILREVGGFSETFRDYGIDPDLTAKVLLSGHDVVYTRKIVLFHYRNWGVDNTRPEYKALMAKQEAAKALYLKKYADLGRGALSWKARRAAWYAARKILGRRYRPDSRSPALGLLWRDWNNIIAGRFISPFDALKTRGTAYHLRQHCPKRAQPRILPPDPAPSTADPGKKPEAA